MSEKDHINPSHYQGFIDNNQWVEARMKSPTFKSAKIPAIILQALKYLDRNGQKDITIQELKKARWYVGYAVKLLYGETNVDKNFEVKIDNPLLTAEFIDGKNWLYCMSKIPTLRGNYMASLEFLCRYFLELNGPYPIKADIINAYVILDHMCEYLEDGYIVTEEPYNATYIRHRD